MSWYAKVTGGYDRTSRQAKKNAANIASILKGQGWSIKSIAALLGNGAGESGLNPWRWESDYVPTYNEFLSWQGSAALSHGYGIFGFTPASNYINSTNETQLAQYGYAPNFSDRQGNASDGGAQVVYFVSTVQQNWTHNLYNYYQDDFAAIGVDINDFYYLTFAEFVSGVDQQMNELSVRDLTGAFELCYEKPADWAAASSFHSRVQNAEYWYDVLRQGIPSDDDFNIMFYLRPYWKK